MIDLERGYPVSLCGVVPTAAVTVACEECVRGRQRRVMCLRACPERKDFLFRSP